VRVDTNCGNLKTKTRLFKSENLEAFTDHTSPNSTPTRFSFSSAMVYSVAGFLAPFSRVVLNNNSVERWNYQQLLMVDSIAPLYPATRIRYQRGLSTVIVDQLPLPCSRAAKLAKDFYLAPLIASLTLAFVYGITTIQYSAHVFHSVSHQVMLIKLFSSVAELVSRALPYASNASTADASPSL
jgi:hypothetical protein